MGETERPAKTDEAEVVAATASGEAVIPAPPSEAEVIEAPPDIEAMIVSQDAEQLGYFVQATGEAFLLQGMAQVGVADFDGAASWFLQWRDFADQVGGALAERWLAGEPLDHMRDILEQESELADAWKGFVSGTADMMRGRTPEVAAASFRQAATSFRGAAARTNDLTWSVMADYAECNEQAARGMEELIRLNNGPAAAAFQGAASRIQRLLRESVDPILVSPEPPPLIPGLATGFQASRDGYTATFHLASYRSQISSGNFSAALGHARKRYELTQHVLENAPAETPRVLRAILEAGLSLSQGDIEVTQGHLDRERREWDEASAAYARAQIAIQAAAGLIAESPQAGAAASQQWLLNQANELNLWIRQCDRERELTQETARVNQELALFRNSAVEALERLGRGVNVTTTVDIANALKQETQVSQTWLQNTEVGVRGAFEDLQSAAATASIDPLVKKTILEKSKEALDVAEHGADFLSKVQKIGQQVVDLAQKAGPAAVGLLPAVKLIAGFLNIPLPG